MATFKDSLPTETAKQGPASPSLLSIRNVAKSFGQNQVLRNVSLEVAEGEFLTILGESGSGKPGAGRRAIGELKRRRVTGWHGFHHAARFATGRDASRGRLSGCWIAGTFLRARWPRSARPLKGTPSRRQPAALLDVSIPD